MEERQVPHGRVRTRVGHQIARRGYEQNVRALAIDRDLHSNSGHFLQLLGEEF